VGHPPRTPGALSRAERDGADVYKRGSGLPRDGRPTCFFDRIFRRTRFIKSEGKIRDLVPGGSFPVTGLRGKKPKKVPERRARVPVS